MPRRKTLPKKELARRMRQELARNRTREIDVSCSCTHPSHRDLSVPQGQRIAGWAWCGNCRHYVDYQGGVALYCITEPEINQPGFYPERTIRYELIPGEEI